MEGLLVIRSEVRGFPPPCPPTSSQNYSIARCVPADSSHPLTRADSADVELHDRIAQA
jgi:hypothetical protein